MSFACLTEELGKSVARVVEFGLIPLASEESNILGNCVLYVSMAPTAASTSSTSPGQTMSEPSTGTRTWQDFPSEEKSISSSST